jgi:hypothetical protein
MKIQIEEREKKSHPIIIKLGNNFWSIEKSVINAMFELKYNKTVNNAIEI